MDDKFKIIIQGQLDEKQTQNTLNKQIKTIADSLNKLDLKININGNSASDEAKKIQHKIETIYAKPIEINTKIATPSMDELKLALQEIRSDVDRISRIDINANAKGNIKDATATYVDNMGKTVKATMQWQEYLDRAENTLKRVFKVTNLHYSDNIAQQEKIISQLDLFKEKMQGQIAVLGQKFQGKISKSVLADFANEVQSLNIDMPDLEHRMTSITNRLGILKQEASSSGTVLGRIFENMYKFLRFYIAGGFLVKAVNSVRDGIQAIRDLDTALVELNKVADLTAKQLQEVADRSFEAGLAIGRTGKEVINATADWVRAGFAIEDAMILSEQSLLLTNVGDGIRDVEDASSSLISVLRGFKMEAGDVVHVVDSLNEVSNNYALDAADLAEILKRVSGTIAQTGTSFDELVGLAVGGFETLRSAEVVASGINMISQRLRGMQEDGEEVADLIPKIQAAFDKYAGGAVSVIDKQNGGLHSTYEILEQLSRVYPTLTDEAKAYINEAVAGNRQNKVLVAIMENWENVQGAIAAASNSLGSAAKENEIYLNSIEGRSKQLESVMQSMWKNFISSDAIKGFIDFQTGLVKIIDKVGLLNAAIVGVSTVLSLVNSKWALFNVEVDKTNKTASVGFALTRGLKQASAEADITIGKMILLKTQAAAMSFGVSLVISATLGAITSAISKHIEKQRELEEYNKNIASSFNSLREHVNGLTKEYEDLSSKTDLGADSKLRLIEIEQDLRRALGETAGAIDLQNGSLQDNIRLINEAIRAKNDEFLARNRAEFLEARDFLENPIYVSDRYGKFMDFSGADITPEQYTEQLVDLIKALNELEEGKITFEDFAGQYKYFAGYLQQNPWHSFRDAIEEVNKEVARVEQSVDTYEQTLRDNISRMVENLLFDANIEEQLRSLNQQYKDGEITIIEYESAIEKLRKSAIGLVDADSDLRGSSKSLAIAREFVNSTFDKSVAAVNKYKDAMGDLNDSTANAEEQQKKLQEALDKASKSFKDVTSKIQSLYKVQHDLNSAGKVTAEITQEIIDKHPELLQYLGSREDLENAITGAITTQESVQSQALQNMLANDAQFYNEKLRGTVELYKEIFSAYGQDVENFKTAAEAKDAIDVAIVNATGSRWSTMYKGTAASLSSAISAMKKQRDALYALPGQDYFTIQTLKDLNTNIRALEGFLKVLTGFETAYKATIGKINLGGINLGGIKTPKSSSSSKSGESSTEKASDAIKKFLDTLANKTELIEFNLAMNQLDQSYYEATGNINKVNQLRVNEINLYKQLNKQINSNIKSVESKLKTVKKGSDDYETLQDTLFNLRQEYRQNEVTINSINDALKEHDRILRDRVIEAEQLVLKAVMAAAKAQYDANKKRLQDEYDTNKKIIQDKIDTLNKEKALIREEYNARRQQKQEEKKLEELQKLETRFNKISKDNSGMYEKEKLDLAKQIADLREEIYEDEVLKQIELREKEIDSQIDGYNKEQELLDANYKTAQEKMDEAYQKAQETYATYWKEVESIMKGSQSSIIKYLQDNLDEYKQAGKLQKEAYLEGWGELFGDVKDIQSGKTKDSATVKKEVGTSTGTNYADTAGSSGSSSGSSSTTSKPYPGTSLKRGSKGENVKAIQRILGVDVDGSFGAKTEAAVKAYQKKHGLQVDGRVGPETWAHMFGTSKSTSTSSKPKVSAISSTLKRGAKGSNVKTLQKALNEILGTNLAVDGSFGAATLAAVLQFQRKYGLSQDGSVGPKTKAKFKALGYDQGGLVDYTGLAIVHGSKKKPEAFLNHKETSIIGDLARAIREVPRNALSNLTRFGGGLTFAPIVNIDASGATKEDAIAIGRTVKTELAGLFDKAQRKSGLAVSVPR